MIIQKICFATFNSVFPLLYFSYTECLWRWENWRTPTLFTLLTMVTILGSLDWSRGSQCHMTLIFEFLSLFVVQV